MHRHHRPGPVGDRRFDPRLVEIERVWPYVDENRPRPGAHERVGRRNEGKGRHDDLVPRPQIQQKGRHLQSGCARRGHQNSMNSETVLQEGLTPAGECPDARQLAASHRLSDVGQLVTNHERSIERDSDRHAALV